MLQTNVGRGSSRDSMIKIKRRASLTGVKEKRHCTSCMQFKISLWQGMSLRNGLTPTNVSVSKTDRYREGMIKKRRWKCRTWLWSISESNEVKPKDLPLGFQKCCSSLKQPLLCYFSGKYKKVYITGVQKTTVVTEYSRKRNLRKHYSNDVQNESVMTNI